MNSLANASNSASKQDSKISEHYLQVYGTQGGCLVQLPSPQKTEEALKWDGACISEFANGQGKLSITNKEGKVIYSGTGSMKQGIRTGKWLESTSQGNFINTVEYIDISSHTPQDSKLPIDTLVRPSGVKK